MVRGAPGSWKAQMEKKMGSYTRRLAARRAPDVLNGAAEFKDFVIG